jgi:hypothetical protein
LVRAVRAAWSCGSSIEKVSRSTSAKRSRAPRSAKALAVEEKV